MSDGREGGFIKLHRRLKSWPLWRHMTALQRIVVVEILMSANWKARETWCGKVGRGELLQSEETLANEAKVSRKVVRNTIALLVEEGFLQRREAGNESGNDRATTGHEKGQPQGRKPSVLTVVNYERYQGEDSEEGPKKGQPGAKRGPSEGQAGAPLEEGEEVEEEKNLLSAASAATVDRILALAGPPPSLFPMAPVVERAPAPANGAAETTAPKPKRSAAPKPEAPSDPRHTPVKTLMASVYAEMRQGQEMPWSGRHGKNLKDLLTSVPNATVDEFERRWRYALGLGRHPGTADPLVFFARWADLVPSTSIPTGRPRVIAGVGTFTTDEF